MFARKRTRARFGIQGRPWTTADRPMVHRLDAAKALGASQVHFADNRLRLRLETQH